MKEMELFQAMGQVNEDFLTEMEAPRSTKKLWKVGLVAAAVGLLTVTAVAAALPGLLKGEFIDDAGVHDYVSIYGPGVLTDDLDVLLEIEAAPNAPATLETPYVPTVLLEMDSNHRIWADYGLEYWCAGDIRYEQFVLTPAEGGRYRARVRGADADSTVEQRMIQCGGFEVLELTYTGGKNGIEVRQLYWSDGMYVYYLMVPYELGEEFYTAVIESNCPLEDTSILERESQSNSAQEATVPQ